MIMDFSLAFESFMIFYLLEVLFLGGYVWTLARDYREQEEQQAAQAQGPRGPSPSDLIKMRAIARELQRQG